MKRAFCLCKLQEIFSTRINEYISIFLEPARDILIKDRGRKKEGAEPIE